MRLIHLRAWLLGAFLCGSAAAASAQAGAPQDLGTAWPAATNISKHPGFNVYRWENNGMPIIQINRANGRVVTAGYLLNSSFRRMPIGEWAPRIKKSGTSANANGLVQTVEAALDENPENGANSGQCPCKAALVYEDREVRLVVVTDKGDRVLELVAIKND
jgi:hypothetical protein